MVLIYTHTHVECQTSTRLLSTSRDRPERTWRVMNDTLSRNNSINNLYKGSFGADVWRPCWSRIYNMKFSNKDSPKTCQSRHVTHRLVISNIPRDWKERKLAVTKKSATTTTDRAWSGRIFRGGCVRDGGVGRVWVVGWYYYVTWSWKKSISHGPPVV